MKIEKLTNNKIRIILNVDDLAEKNIDVHTLIKNTNISQKFFRAMLKKAKKEVGFDVDNSKLLIEASLSIDGFFILTFTKLDVDENLPSQKFNPFKQDIKKKNPNPNCDTAIYEFDTFEEFENFCTYLRNSQLDILHDFAKNISLYQYMNKYFLVFSNINLNCKRSEALYTSISEFARLISTSPLFEGKLIEYGEIILKNKKNIIKYC